MILLNAEGDMLQAEASAADSIVVAGYGMHAYSDTGVVDKYARLFNVVLSGSGVDTIYTVPANKFTQVVEIVIVNYSVTDVTVTLYHIDDSGMVESKNIVVPGVSFPAKSLTVWNKGRISRLPIPGTGGAVWGAITGAIADQTDLYDILTGLLAAISACPRLASWVDRAADGNVGTTQTTVFSFPIPLSEFYADGKALRFIFALTYELTVPENTYDLLIEMNGVTLGSLTLSTAAGTNTIQLFEFRIQRIDVANMKVHQSVKVRDDSNPDAVEGFGIADMANDFTVDPQPLTVKIQATDGGGGVVNDEVTLVDLLLERA